MSNNNSKLINNSIRRYFRIKSQDTSNTGHKAITVGWAKVKHTITKVAPMPTHMTYDEVSVAFGNKVKRKIVPVSREAIDNFPVTLCSPSKVTEKKYIKVKARY